MSRILIAWELGANYGHITRQLPIAKILRAQGHEILFAVRDTNVAAQILVLLNIKFIQAPIATTSNRLSEPPVNYAEILIASGYGDTVQLNGLLRMVQSYRIISSQFHSDRSRADRTHRSSNQAHTRSTGWQWF